MAQSIIEINSSDFDTSDSEDEAELIELAQKVEARSNPPAPAIPTPSKTPRTSKTLAVLPGLKRSTGSNSGSSIPLSHLQQLSHSSSTSSSSGSGRSVNHHKLNNETLYSYVYPTNLSERDYQMNIVRKALFHNVLCALPTGLGKTFIASTVMLNWYRWTVDAKIIFMAPTRPLVSQQIEACLSITGIPKSDACVMIGSNARQNRPELWNTKRVFFATPQIVHADLQKGVLDPKSIVCLVFDEAHRATGNYSYVEIVKFVHRFQESCRILALTATPSGKVDGVQQVIDNLKISKIEIRTEESLDVRQYVHKKHKEKIVVEPSEEQTIILEHLDKCVKPLLTQANDLGAYYVRDTASITQFGALSSLQKYNAAQAGKPNQGIIFKVRGIMQILIKVGQAVNLLKVHGIVPFYNLLVAYKEETENEKNKDGKKRKSYKHNFVASEGFIDCMDYCHGLIYDSGGRQKSDFIGHEKLQHLVDIVTNFFLESSGSKGIIFAEFRDSAAEIERVLSYYCPLHARPHLFIGQSASSDKTGKKKDDVDKPTAKRGMRQKEQQKVVEMFKNGEYNLLIATSIGEEGLDIGDVDLIICYDQSKSPIRSLQRIGRTGRKRDGKVYYLLTSGEENKLDHSIDGYKYIQDSINKNGNFQYEENNRILPMTIKPMCEKKLIEIPEENKEVLDATQKAKDIVEVLTKVQKKARAKPKKVAKKFFLPDNARLGFLTASEVPVDEEGNVPKVIKEAVIKSIPKGKEKVPHKVMNLDDIDEHNDFSDTPEDECLELKDVAKTTPTPPQLGDFEDTSDDLQLSPVKTTPIPLQASDFEDTSDDLQLSPVKSTPIPLQLGDFEDTSDDLQLSPVKPAPIPHQASDFGDTSDDDLQLPPVKRASITHQIDTADALPPPLAIAKKTTSQKVPPLRSFFTVASRPSEGVLSASEEQTFNRLYKTDDPPDCIEYDPLIGAQSPTTPPKVFIGHSTTSELFRKAIQKMKNNSNKRSLSTEEPTKRQKTE